MWFSSGRIASVTDSHALKTTYSYNSNGRLATITDPSSQTLTFSYNGSNHISSVKDSTGREVKFGYSARLRFDPEEVEERITSFSAAGNAGPRRSEGMPGDARSDSISRRSRAIVGRQAKAAGRRSQRPRPGAEG